MNQDNDRLLGFLLTVALGGLIWSPFIWWLFGFNGVVAVFLSVNVAINLAILRLLWKP